MFHIDVSGSSGFINLESLIGQSVVTFPVKKYQSLYPEMTFTCDGTIYSWTVLARPLVVKPMLFPELQLWREGTNGVLSKVDGITLHPGGCSFKGRQNRFRISPVHTHEISGWRHLWDISAPQQWH